MEGQLRAKPIECRDDGVVWQMPDGSIKLETYRCEKKPKKKRPKTLTRFSPGLAARSVLAQLDQHERLRTSEIVEKTDRSKSSVKDNLVKLEAAGLVARIPGSRKERIWSITEEGRTALQNGILSNSPKLRPWHGHSGIFVLRALGEAKKPLSTLDLVKLGQSRGIHECTIREAINRIGSRYGFASCEKRPVFKGRQHYLVGHWTITKAGLSELRKQEAA